MVLSFSRLSKVILNLAYYLSSMCIRKLLCDSAFKKKERKKKAHSQSWWFSKAVPLLAVSESPNTCS